jgi:hypothetical protein
VAFSFDQACPKPPAVRLWCEPPFVAATRRLVVHARRPHLRRARCAAGCGRWPCPAFREALDQIVARAWRWQLAAAADRMAHR